MPGKNKPPKSEQLNKQRELDGLPPISEMMWAANLELQRRQVDAAGGSTRYQPLAGVSKSVASPSDFGAVKGVVAEAVTGGSTCSHGRGRVRVYPSVLAELHKARLDPVGRGYALLKHLDRNGRGWFLYSEIREYLSDASSEYFCSSWRTMRRTINHGMGIAWYTVNVHGEKALFLSGPAKVMIALNAGELHGDAVLLPVSGFTSGIRKYRSMILASFLEGRKDPDRPISQVAIRCSTGIAERTQRTYYDPAGITTKRNIEIYKGLNDESRKETAWENGRNFYSFKDVNGMQGKKGAMVSARNLPSSYKTNEAETAPRGRRKKINKEINMLVTKAVASAIQVIDPSEDNLAQRIYFDDGKAAVNAVRRGSTHKALYPSRRGGLIATANRKAKLTGVQYWYAA